MCVCVCVCVCVCLFLSLCEPKSTGVVVENLFLFVWPQQLPGAVGINRDMAQLVKKKKTGI